MTAINPSRPRQRVSPSPTGKDSLHTNSDIATRYVDRKEQQQPCVYSSTSQLPIENCLPKRQPRNHGLLHWSTCYMQQLVIFLILIVLVSAALTTYIHTAPAFLKTSDYSLEVPSRSLLWKVQNTSSNQYPDIFETETLDQLHVSDNPHPRIVWLMSFPNRYVVDYLVLLLANDNIRMPF
jgi:hypothetical protein